MKYGRTLMELAQEIERQNNAKRDYLVDTAQLTMGLDVTDKVRQRSRPAANRPADGHSAPLLSPDAQRRARPARHQCQPLDAAPGRGRKGAPPHGAHAG